MAKRPPKAKAKTKAEVKGAADRAEARSKTAKKADTVKAPDRPYSGARMISENDLRNLMRQCRGLKDDMDEINGMLREKIAYAVEKKNLNKKAFALIRSFDRMEAEKLADLWDTLGFYMDMSGLSERIKSVTRLPLPESAGQDNDDADPVEAQEPAPPEGAVSRPRLALVNEDVDNKIPA